MRMDAIDLASNDKWHQRDCIGKYQKSLER